MSLLRIRFDDLLAYQRKDDEERRRVADELTADAQELGMGDQVVLRNPALKRLAAEKVREAPLDPDMPDPLPGRRRKTIGDRRRASATVQSGPFASEPGRGGAGAKGGMMTSEIVPISIQRLSFSLPSSAVM